MTDRRIEVQGAEPLIPGACRVIAEAGANHNNSVDQAVELTRRAGRRRGLGCQIPDVQGRAAGAGRIREVLDR